jgi:hypothetical protein
LHDAVKRQWLEVCAEAAITDDPQRLAELTNEIIAILRAEQQRLEKQQKSHTAA